MGTRNLTIVISEGKTKVAQYGQWDGYPEGQGKTVLKFLRKCDLNVFKEKLKRVSFLTQKKTDKLWNECKIKGDNIVYPELSRDTGAKVLQLIYDGKAVKLWNRSDFLKDSLFCEWVYIIDLDKGKFEVYSSYSKKPLTKKDRFYNVKFKKDSCYPIKIIKSYSLRKLPTVKQFIKDSTFESHKDSEELAYNIIINHKFKQ
jgi:hypothetical protein